MHAPDYYYLIPFTANIGQFLSVFQCPSVQNDTIQWYYAEIILTEEIIQDAFVQA